MKLKSFPRSKKISSVQSLSSQSTYMRRLQSCAWRLPKYWPPTPLSTQRVCPPPAPKAGGGGVPPRRRCGGWGAMFWKTPAIGLASYSLISLRLSLSIELVALWQVLPPNGHFTRVNHTGLVSRLAHRLYLHIQQHLPNSSHIERVIFCLVCLASSFSSFIFGAYVNCAFLY